MLRRGYYSAAYGVSWVIFAAGALLLNALCFPLLLVPPSKAVGIATRRAIRGLFRIWIGWLRCTGLVRFEWRNFPEGLPPGAAVYVANHPGLLDATFLLARLPDAICLMKSAVLRNPLLAPAARAAGYVAGDQGVDMIRELADRLTEGRTVLIFPEGTRTRPGVAFNDLKPGFALVARRAGAPIQVILIEASRDLLPRGHRWWRVPRFPSHCRITADLRIQPAPSASVASVRAAVERRFADALSP